LTRDSVTKNDPEKKLTAKLHKTGGRNNHGRITTRHIGGGHKRRYRLIDFKRRKDGVPATVAAIEYDPNRSANIALLHYHDGEKRYILAPRNLAGQMPRWTWATRSPSTGYPSVPSCTPWSSSLAVGRRWPAAPGRAPR
jgi:hypothetical protein